MVFNKAPSLAAVEHYLEASAPWDEIYLTLFSHGVDSIGLVPIERWRAVLARARREGRFVGVDERAFPRDFAVFARFHRDLRRVAPPASMPRTLRLAHLERFLGEVWPRYDVRWLAAEGVERVEPRRTA
jgi:hypothetical protein